MINNIKLKDLGIEEISAINIDSSNNLERARERIIRSIQENFRTTINCLNVLNGRKRKGIDCNKGQARDFNCKNFIKFGFVCNTDSCKEEEE